jgi:hypothetical protein
MLDLKNANDVIGGALVMNLWNDVATSQLFYLFNLEEVVPDDHLVRSIARSRSVVGSGRAGAALFS